MTRFRVVCAALGMTVGLAAPAAAEPPEAAVEAVVRLAIEVPADARTARNLGTRRTGSGIVIDGDGLVLTVGYLMAEASGAALGLADGRQVAARPIAYDHDSGFGLLRASAPLGVRPLALGDSAAVAVRDRVLVVSHGGAGAARGAWVVGRREFAGGWEYLLEQAIFTAPAHPQFAGAALIDDDGRLVGVGSLSVADALEGAGIPGNVFVPIDLLKPVLGDLLALGRSGAPPRPWLGVTGRELRGGRLVIERVAEDGPAARAGLRRGDVLVGVAEQLVSNLADFYRKLWSLGEAGIEVPLRIARQGRSETVAVRSVDRLSWMRTGTSY